MPSEIRIWRRREPSLFHAIMAVLLAQVVVGLVFWCASAWRLHVHKLSFVRSGAAGRLIAPPLPRPMGALILILLPAVTWGVALVMSRRLKPEMQHLLERWGDRDDDELWESAILIPAMLPAEAAIPRREPGRAREAEPARPAPPSAGALMAGFGEMPEAAAAGPSRAGGPSFQRFIATWSPPLGPHRPRGRQPPAASFDPPVPPGPLPASCRPQCEAVRR